MNELQYVRANAADVALLAEYRIAFLTELVGPQPEEKADMLRQELANYFTNALEDRSCICWLAKVSDTIAGVGAMTVRVQPGSFKNPSGKMGYIMNMYTLPGFRKKGICSTLLNKLMATGNEMGITAFELHATKDGEPVYKKNGFAQHQEPTYRKYE